MAFRFAHRFVDGLFQPRQDKKAATVSFHRPPTLAEQVARLVRSHEMDRFAESQGMETFEEADDFEIDDDPFDPSSPYEKDFDIAAVQAEHHGLVHFDRSPAVEADKRVQDAKKGLFKRKSASPAPTPPEGKEESVDDDLGQ